MLVEKFVKNPVEIDAVQFTEENKDQVFAWATQIQQNVYHGWEDNQPILKIPTLEGFMTCSLNDYLIVEPFPTDWRKLYPCKPDIFKKTYTKIEICPCCKTNRVNGLKGMCTECDKHF
jgi:hypothetical protein